LHWFIYIIAESIRSVIRSTNSIGFSNRVLALRLSGCGNRGDPVHFRHFLELDFNSAQLTRKCIANLKIEFLKIIKSKTQKDSSEDMDNGLQFHVIPFDIHLSRHIKS